MQFNPGSLFLGATPSHERSYLAKVLSGARERYKRLVIPCCGKFGGAETAVAVGWSPDRISCSDVSLFSTLVGFHIMGRRLDELEIRLAGDLECLDAGDPATALYALKLAILRRWAGTQYHKQLVVREVERGIGRHIEGLRTQLDNLRDKLAGLAYCPRDLFDHLPEAMDDPEAVVWAAPPAYLKGYEKMFDAGDAVTWKAPAYRIFDPKTGYPEVRAMMTDRPALGLRFVYAQLEAGEEAECVCAEATGGATGRSGAEYILANRPHEVGQWIGRVAFVPRQTEIKPLAAPILEDDHILTPESSVVFRRVAVPEAMYYRDLFAHRLGSTSSSEHFVLLLDGRVAGVVGFGSAFSRTFQKRTDAQAYMTEMYGFTAPTRRYPRLNRLLMMLITTEEMHAVWRPRETAVQRYAGISTTCLAEHTEVKINRGILKRVSKEKQANGLWKLSYVARWRKETFSQALRRWLDTHGSPEHARLDS